MKSSGLADFSSKTKFVEFFSAYNPLILDSGEKLINVRVAYQTYGKLNDEATNAIIVCHALTGNSHAAGVLNNEESDPNSEPDLLRKYSKMFKGKPGWWDGVVGPGRVFDTSKYFVICSNILGSCYGTTGPVSIDPQISKPYQANFPTVTVRDMVKVEKALMDYLGVNRIKTVTGGSLGGMQALEWGVMYPEIVESIIPIGTSAKHSAWAIGLGELERLAIKNDPDWANGFYKNQPARGLSLARQIAMVTYRSFPSFEEKFGRDKVDENELYQVISYLGYQGQKLVERFDANSYLLLANAMDHHDLGSNRDKVENVLGAIRAKTLVIGISSDVLYPMDEQKFLVQHIPSAKYAEISSRHGHDAFLMEFDQLEKIIGEFLNSVKP